MIKEFNLSDKLIECPTGDIIEGCEEWYYHLRKEDVREFIRLLKEEFCYPNEGICKLCKKETFVNMNCDCFECVIDKLAGDKLLI
jgi:hypothetical protein